MSEQGGAGAVPRDRIDADLERALFKRFWSWLAIVGSFVIAAVTAISVLVSQVLLLTAKSASERAAQRELDQLSNKISAIDTRSVDVAARTAINQEKSEAAASAATKQLDKINKLLDTQKSILTGNDQIESVAKTLAGNKEFAKIVLEQLHSAFEFKFVRSPSVQQEVKLYCPAESRLISASCVGNNGSPQAAVGPVYGDDGSVSCYRYGNQAMPVQATAVCLSLK